MSQTQIDEYRIVKEAHNKLREVMSLMIDIEMNLGIAGLEELATDVDDFLWIELNEFEKKVQEKTRSMRRELRNQQKS